jgi:Protein of unknown function (DUF1553)/Protein of unknown function (DUF1549)/Concanavalin A-like lectin/glucanases superfamily/Planctomycete cytochrome C
MTRTYYAIAFCLGVSLTNLHIAVGQIDFERDVRPILSEHCFACHGPDSGKRQAGLRLDRKDSAFSQLETGVTAFVAGKIEASEAIARMKSKDKDAVMPPPGSKPLSAKQIEVLSAWVEQGANWKEHWAFDSISRPAVPQSVLAEGEVANPIDAFVLAKLKQLGLKQSTMESKERLLRRVSLDLTGLPPTLRELDDFLNDRSEQAYESAVDRLLSSQHYGERMAIPWLDLARYGDTSGYHNDSLRDMWLWRQWVINAFNNNMPFDQFTIEQLAGDLIPGATIDQRIASGFHRNVMTSDEGGLIDAEYRNLYVVDRIATTGVTWLGMTIACAQCHDHKYDPISQKDYYRLYAFFNNVPENGKDGVRDRNPMPFLRVPSAEQSVQLQSYEQTIRENETSLTELNTTLPERQAAWEKAVLAQNDTEPKAHQLSTIAPTAYFPFDESGQPASTGEGIAFTTVVQGQPIFDEGFTGKAFKTDGRQWFEYGDQFGFEKDQAFSVAAFLAVSPEGGSPFGKMNDKKEARGWDVEFHGLRPSVHLISRWPENAIHIQAVDDLPANTFTHLAFTYDGSGKAAGLKLYVNGLQAKTNVVIDKLRNTIKTPTPFSVGRRGDSSTPFHGSIDELQIFNRQLNEGEVLALNASDTLRLVRILPDQRNEQQKTRITKFFQQSEVPELARLQNTINETRKARDAFEAAIPNTMVMSEMEKPRETFIKVRGNYDQDGDKVVAAVPSFLPQVAQQFEERPLSRLDFAHWLVASEHPLTARVTVNRWWAMLFGTGIVKTLNDFGSQGERPSHPELLDWLASDLMRDWDTKRVIKQIVMSATYRQASAVSPTLKTLDQENRLLARGPRQRLDAELLRDNALSIAGILNPKIGGKSIKPSQPEGTWEINEMSGYKYEKSLGEDLYRRGLYVYWRRSTVYPSFVTLDAPTREFCVAQRAKTSTPLQSLVLMNDPVFVEAARAFAQRLLSEEGLDDSGRLRLAWRLSLSRSPSEKEQAVLQNVLAQQQATYRANGDSAKQLASVGDFPKASNMNEADTAAWTAVCNVILNLNETISN